MELSILVGLGDFGKSQIAKDNPHTSAPLHLSSRIGQGDDLSHRLECDVDQHKPAHLYQWIRFVGSPSSSFAETTSKSEY
jgi:hypothetical protein